MSFALLKIKKRQIDKIMWKIECEWDMGFAEAYKTEEDAWNAIQVNPNWSDIDGGWQSAKEDGLLSVIPIMVSGSPKNNTPKDEYKPANCSWYDVEELAAYVLGKYDEYEEDSDELDLDDLVYEKFDCSMETFQTIIEHLLPLANTARSPLTDEIFRGFSIDLGEGNGQWILKQKV